MFHIGILKLEHKFVVVVSDGVNQTRCEDRTRSLAMSRAIYRFQNGDTIERLPKLAS